MRSAPSFKTGSSEKDAVNLRIVLVPAVSFGLGLAGLIWAERLEGHNYSATWILAAISILKHSSELLGAAGLIGLLLELSLRRQLKAEILHQIRILFRVDREVANALNEGVSKEIVKTTLIAHLGDNLGPAIFNGLVRRYLEEKDVFRRDAKYEITLRELQQDCTIGNEQHSKIFAATEYFEIAAEYEFTRVFDKDKHKYVICIFGNDWDHLLKQFKDPNCILRETLPLRSSDQAGIAEILKNNPGEMAKVCAVSAKINHKEVELRPVEIRDSGIVFELARADVAADKPLLHQITIHGLVAKSARRFPIVIVEPTWAPTFTFTSRFSYGYTSTPPDGRNALAAEHKHRQ